MTPGQLRDLLSQSIPSGFCSTHTSIRWVRNHDHYLSVRQNVFEPGYSSSDEGFMVTVVAGGGIGYASGTDLTQSGVSHAFHRARTWAEATAGRTIVNYDQIKMPAPVGAYRTKTGRPWDTISSAEKVELLLELCKALKTSEDIVDWSTSIQTRTVESIYVTMDGGEVVQHFDIIDPRIVVRANKGADTQTRTLSGNPHARQGGWEVLEEVGFFAAAPMVAEEARQLLDAPNCPTGFMDALIAPDQMVLQIHESIGHPLELDRILGDERNYAGRSFVSLDMVSKYQYGSSLLNVTYDPHEPGEIAAFAFDDEGSAAKKEYLIKDGLLVRLLGGTISQQRAGVAGVATARATSWNRPPIDRMSNLNVECGTSTLNDMISRTERGIYLKSNCSWSIDDSRNKFQFSCEWAQLIENGKLTTIVKNPSYRGISSTFWRNLVAVGDQSTRLVMGTPNCGKGEPNQAIHVGHASPACLFRDIDVFGGDS